MRAIVCRSAGRFHMLRLEEIQKPAVPDDGVLVRVQAASVNPADFFQLTRVAQLGRRLRRESQKGPAVIGTDLTGTVEAVGPNVTEFRPGDDVFGGARGAFAEFLVVREKGSIVHKAGGAEQRRRGRVTT